MTEANARLVKDAEAYYRVMYHGSAESWNLRDTHMFETLNMILSDGEGAELKGDCLGPQQPHRQRRSSPTWARTATK